VNIDGLVYLLNQAGIALAQANARIAELETALTAAHPDPDRET
jgi:hypothetical protein